MKIVNGVTLAFTPEEEAAADIKEAEAIANAPAKAEARLEAQVDRFMANDRVLALMIFDILKVLNAQGFDLSADFAGVTNKATFREHVKNRIRGL